MYDIDAEERIGKRDVLFGISDIKSLSAITKISSAFPGPYWREVESTLQVEAEPYLKILEAMPSTAPSQVKVQ